MMILYSCVCQLLYFKQLGSIFKTEPAPIQQNMKPKLKDETKKSILPLKMLFLSYFNTQQSTQLLSDCHNAINDKITKLAQKIQQNFEEISSIVQDDPKSKFREGAKMMQVIEQEDYWGTERSNGEGQSVRNTNVIVRKFNQLIGMVDKSTERFEGIMFMYKNEIKDIAKDLTKEKELNLQLRKQLKQRSSSKQFREPRSISTNEAIGKRSSSFTKPPLSAKTIIKPTKTKQSLRPSRQAQSQDEQARPAPKPFCEECLAREKQDQLKQSRSIQEKNKWRQLSTKITNLKNQLSRYEQQLVSNQTQITRLNEQLRKRSQDSQKQQTEEKKKIRSMNTTLRGEKIVLESQLQFLKKKLQQSSQYITTLQSQNKKLTIQKDNLQSTIKWHTNTIQDLRNNFSSGIKQQGELLSKYTQSQQTNQVLIEQIAAQEKYLQQFAQNLKIVEASHEKEINKLSQKVKELQQIIEQKNQTIIKLKIGKYEKDQPPKEYLKNSLKESNKRDTHLSGTIMNKTLKKEALGIVAGNNTTGENFEQNMVKVLNKKLAMKECEIEKLKRDNQLLRAQLEVYKECE